LAEPVFAEAPMRKGSSRSHLYDPRTQTYPAPPIGKDWTGAEISAALKRRGTSLKQLAIGCGYKAKNNGTSFSHVTAEHRPKAERIIGNVLGVRPSEIWPSRYAANRFRIEHLNNARTRVPGIAGKRSMRRVIRALFWQSTAPAPKPTAPPITFGLFVGEKMADVLDWAFPATPSMAGNGIARGKRGQ
jgi:Ner family transcriptional regulator